MWDTIRRLVDTGSTVLLTTQYLDEADQLADRIAVIDRGHVVAEGTVDELKASVGTSALHLRVQHEGDVTNAREIVEQVLDVRSSITDTGGKTKKTVVSTAVFLVLTCNWKFLTNDCHFPMIHIQHFNPYSPPKMMGHEISQLFQCQIKLFTSCFID